MTLRSDIHAIKISALIGLSLVCMAGPAISGKTPDTPETLMKQAKASASGRALANKLYDDLSTKRPFAAGVLSAAQSEDKKAVSKAIAADLNLSESQVTIEEVAKDVYVRGSYTTSGGTVIRFCIDTDEPPKGGTKRCGGHGYSVTVSGE
jgi:hypothetical protein